MHRSVTVAKFSALTRTVFMLLFILLHLASATVFPPEREDVIGRYTVGNEKQCYRLCWYRAPCDSYSYLPLPHSSAVEVSDSPNCVLHMIADGTTNSNSTPALPPPEPWVEKTASNAGITNACATRRCAATKICVPKASSTQGPSDSGAHVCHLLAPPNCSTFNDVTNADVIVRGDVVEVVCRSGFVALPVAVPVVLKCQLTSKWQAFEGSCVQYEFLIPGGSDSVTKALVMKVQNSSAWCVKGVYAATTHTQFQINIYNSTNYNNWLHIAVRFEWYGRNFVVYSPKIGGIYGAEMDLGDHTLRPGDPFSLTFQVVGSGLVMKLNDEAPRTIDLLFIKQKGFDFYTADTVYFFQYANVTYVNLIEAC